MNLKNQVRGETVLRKIGSLLILLFSYSIFAQQVDVEIIPKSPVAGETFKVLFKVKGRDAEIPTISFNPINIEVLGRENQGISTRSTFINGTLTMTREVVIAYEMIAAKPGFARLDDIILTVGGNRIKYNNLRMNIIKKGVEQSSDGYFVVAVPSKEKAYVNESIMVDYYVYSEGQISSREIRKFPTLKNFVKRFIQKDERLERVQLNGKIYYRILMYSAQLFPNANGKAVIDPITVKIQYAERSNDPFGAFSFGFRSLKSKTLSSKPVEIEVMPLPPIDSSKLYTGLVGNHEFRFKINKNKFLANEPIEITLEVKGNGLLENFEAPKFFQTNKIEEFETNVDLKLTKTEEASKIMKYTFLGRENYSSDKKDIEFYYFDPVSGKYNSELISIPPITIVGSVATTVSSSNINKESNTKNSNNVIFQDIKPSIIAPIFDARINSQSDITSKLTKIFLILSFGLIIFELFIYFKFQKIKNNFEKNIDLLKSGNADYTILYKVFEPFIKKKQTLDESIDTIEISEPAKKAFRDVILKIEKINFSAEKTKEKNIKIDDSYLNELKKRFYNENNSRY